MDNLTKLPKEWNYFKLKDLCGDPKKDIVDGPFGSDLKRSDYKKEGAPVLKIQNIKPNRLLLKKMDFVSHDKAKELKRHSFKAGDLIITKLGDPLGVACVVPKDQEDGIIVADLIRVRTAKVPIKYLCYAFNSPVVSNYINSKQKGTTRPRVKLTIVRDLPIPLAPEEIIDKIVDLLEAQFTRLDASVKDLQSVKKKLGLYRKSVLKNAFEGKLSKVSGWLDGVVNDLGEIVTGTTPSKSNLEYYGNQYCFFKPKDLNAGYSVNSARDMLSESGSKQARMLPEKSIMVTCIGATIGKTGLSRVIGTTNQQINSIIPYKNVCLPELVYYLFILDSMQEQIVGKSSSTTLPILNKSKFSQLEIKIPKKINEQEQIVLAIESRFSVIDKIEETVNHALVKTEKLRKSILKSAFEGKLIQGIV